MELSIENLQEGLILKHRAMVVPIGLWQFKMAEQFGVMELVKDILSTINDAMKQIRKRVLRQVKEEETNTSE